MNNLLEKISQQISLKKSGKNLIGICPFHQEKTPSFTIAPNKNFWYCFGCGKFGTIQNLFELLSREQVHE